MKWFNIIQKNMLPAGELERRTKARKEREAKENSAKQASAVAAKRKEIANVPPAPNLPPVEQERELTPEQIARKKKLQGRKDLYNRNLANKEEARIKRNTPKTNITTGKQPQTNVNRPNITPAPPPTNAPQTNVPQTNVPQTNVPQTPKYGDFPEPKVQPKAPQRKTLQGYNPATSPQKKNLSGRVKAALQRRKDNAPQRQAAKLKRKQRKSGLTDAGQKALEASRNRNKLEADKVKQGIKQLRSNKTSEGNKKANELQSQLYNQ